VQRFSEQVGRRPAIVFWFQAWAGEPPFPREEIAALSSAGHVPMVSWEPWDPRPGADNARFRPRSIAAGTHDRYIGEWARAAAEARTPLLVRFGHEMNGPWYPWGSEGNSAEEYVAAFRHVVELFRAAGASNVRFVWAPNVEYPGSAPLGPLYPGDDFVDWICIDGFNWGTSRADSRWQSLSELFGPTYDKVVALAPSKRLMLETASAEVGGAKSGWIRDGLGGELPKRLSRVEALLWFDELKEADWRVDSSPAALTAMREVVAGERFASTLRP
jgi:hypothetical protein